MFEQLIDVIVWFPSVNRIVHLLSFDTSIPSDVDPQLINDDKMMELTLFSPLEVVDFINCPDVYDDVIDYAWDIGIRNAFVQEEGTQSESFIPDFDISVL